MLIKKTNTLGINLKNSDFEEYGKNGYIPYKGTVSDVPLNEVYTSALYTSIVSSSVSPIIGSNSGIISKTANNAKGEGIYTEFTIDEGYRGSQIQVSFKYKTSVNYADNDIGIYIFDMDSNVLYSPSIVNLQGNISTSPFLSSFLCNSTSQNYRLYFHIQSTNALAYDIKIDSVEISPFILGLGAAVGATQVYPLTIGATTTPPTKGTVVEDVATWARHGDKMLWSYRYRQSAAGSAGSGTFLFPLPAGHSIDLVKHPIGSVVGNGRVGNTVDGVSATNRIAVVVVYSNTAFSVQWISPTATSELLGVVGVDGLNLSTAIITYSLNATVSIAEWTTSNINLASDFQEFAFNTQASINTNDTTSFGYGSGGAAILSNTAVTYYDVAFKNPIQPTDLIQLEVRSKVDGAWVPIDQTMVPSLFCWLGQGVVNDPSNSTRVQTSGVSLSKVTASRVRVYFQNLLWGGSAFGQSSTTSRTWANITSAADGFDRWRVRKISNGNMAEVPPVVFANYENTAGGASPTAPFNYQTRIEDTHNAVTVGAAWKFTCPVPGLYRISGNFIQGATAQSSALYKNGSEIKARIGGANASSNFQVYETVVRLNVGDYVDVRLASAGGAADARANIYIERIGG